MIQTTYGPELASAALASSIGAINAYINWKAVQDTNKTNMQIAEEEREFNLKMWQMMNEYNDPAAQMQRLRNAGLSPLLAYSHLSNSTTMPPTSTTYRAQAPQIDISNIINIITNLSSLLLNNKLIKEKIKEEQIENMFRSERLLIEKQQRLKELEQSDIDIQTKKLLIDKTKEEIKSISLQNEITEKTKNEKIQLLIEQVEDQKLKNELQRIIVSWQKAKSPKEYEILKAQLEKLKAETKNIETQTKIKEIELSLQGKEEEAYKWLDEIGINAKLLRLLKDLFTK